MEEEQHRVFVGNLHQDISEDLIEEAFGYVAPVEAVKLIWEHETEPTPFAFVTVSIMHFMRPHRQL
jgi:RNA recognition motif-containing protein